MRAFICPKCSEIMCKDYGTYDVWYCIPCKYYWDVYGSEGTEPVKIQIDKHDLKLYDIWTDSII